MWAQIAVGFVSSTLCFFIGLGIWAYYQSNGADFPTLTRNDQIFPVFIASKLPMGLAGLALAGIAAASVSTLSANMNSTAAAFATDFYARLFKGRNTLLCGKAASLGCGILGCAFAIVLANMNIVSAYEQFQRYLGMLTAGLACLFLMGRFMPCVNGVGAVCGLAANYVVTFGLDLLPWPGKPHLLLYGLLGMLVCLVVAVLASRFSSAH
jgi:Na+/proline symporter